MQIKKQRKNVYVLECEREIIQKKKKRRVRERERERRAEGPFRIWKERVNRSWSSIIYSEEGSSLILSSSNFPFKSLSLVFFFSHPNFQLSNPHKQNERSIHWITTRMLGIDFQFPWPPPSLRIPLSSLHPIPLYHQSPPSFLNNLLPNIPFPSKSFPKIPKSQRNWNPWVRWRSQFPSPSNLQFRVGPWIPHSL